MIINQENQLETNQETTVNNIQNNLDLNSQATAEKESLDVDQQGGNISSTAIEANKNTEIQQEPNNQDSRREESTPPIAPPEIEAETTVAVETELTSGDDLLASESREKLQAEIKNLKGELEGQKEQNEAKAAQYLRIVADFENFRRRTAKEKEDLEQQIKKKTINEILSVVDNFERARNQIKPANEGEMAIHKSYQGVYKNLVDSLKKIGVSAMRPEGKPFDPNYHEAMLREATNEYPEGTVIEQLVRGYLLNEEILRHAMVKVAAPVEDESEGESVSAAQPELNDRKID
jgi:molecular chaperone GrpE